jgi:hypothetical protein
VIRDCLSAREVGALETPHLNPVSELILSEISLIKQNQSSAPAVSLRTLPPPSSLLPDGFLLSRYAVLPQIFRLLHYLFGRALILANTLYEVFSYHLSSSPTQFPEELKNKTCLGVKKGFVLRKRKMWK